MNTTNTFVGSGNEKSRINYFSFLIKYNSNNKLALGSLKTNNLMFNNIKFKYFFHSSSILKSERPYPQPIYDSTNPQPIFADPLSNSNYRSHILEVVERLERERLSKLQLIKYKETAVDDEEPPGVNTLFFSSSETYPWITNDEGRLIDHTQPIRMFDGVKLIARYLEARFDINPELISETKLTEILEVFAKNGETITVEELYEHINVMYKKDNNFYSEKLITETENLAKFFKFTY